MKKKVCLSLSQRLEGMWLKIPTDAARVRYGNSESLTKTLWSNIPNRPTNIHGKTKQQIKNERKQRNNDQLEILRQNMEEDKRKWRLNEINTESGASISWQSLQSKDSKEYDFNIEHFWKALRIRCNWTFPRTPAEFAWNLISRTY